jgi:hypothetical protein
MSRQRLLVSISFAFACACGNAGSSDTQDSPPPDAGVVDDAAAGSAPDAAPDAAARTGLKRHYGHYFATNYNDTPADAAMLCSKPGVTGVVWRQTWRDVETARGSYDFRSFDNVLAAIATSPNPKCQVWLFVEFKSFANSPVKNPCPVYLASAHSAVNSLGNGASTCFMWEPVVYNAYIAMMKAAAARYDANPRVEGIIFEESALSLGDAQDVANGGTYTPLAWRNALIALVDGGAAAFPHSRVLAFLNFIRGGQAYLDDVSAAISAVPNNQACYSGPDLLPDNTSLYNNANSTYEQLVRHTGCRSNSAQNDSYGVSHFGLESIFGFAVGGTFGSFDATAPRTSGVCINSYLFWNHLEATSSTGLTWNDALPVIAAHPYGTGWYGQCAGGGAAP